jgi:hypothetical protein
VIIREAGARLDETAVAGGETNVAMVAVGWGVFT